MGERSDLFVRVYLKVVRLNWKSLFLLCKKFLVTYKFSSFFNTQQKGITPPLTNKQTEHLAKYLGFKLTNEMVRQKPVYTNGRFFIVQDISSHIGGTWKMADTVDNLKSKSTRLGTFDPLLNYMGE